MRRHSTALCGSGFTHRARCPGAHTAPRPADSSHPLFESFGGSLVFAYKLNWQSVLFVGYGDRRELDELDRLEPARREVFVKISYAFQS